MTDTKYMGVSRCPDGVSLFVKWANRLPPPERCEEIIRALDKLAVKAYEPLPVRELNRAVRKIVRDKEFFDYLADGIVSFVEDVREKFESLLVAERVLDAIALSNSMEAAHNGVNWIIGEKFTNRSRAGLLEACLMENRFPRDRNLVNLDLDDEGHVVVRLTGILQVFKEEKILFNRIRRCPVCLNIYWAKMITSKTCGEKNCADSLYQQEQLSDSKKREARNKQRRENYRQRKKTEARRKARS